MTLKFWFPIFFITVFSSCGGGSSEKDVENDLSIAGTLYQGSISLPENVSASEVINAYSNESITSNGSFQFRAPTKGRILTIAESDVGDPLFAGWLGEKSKKLDARTTAEVIAFYATGAFTAPFSQQERLKDLFSDLEMLDNLANLIETELSKNNRLLSKDNTTFKDLIKPELDAIVKSLYGSADASNTKTGLSARALLVNPTVERSGLRIDTLSGLNEIQITNRFRRTGFAFIDRVSIFNDQGEVASAKNILKDKVEASLGLDGGLGTINQVITASFEPGGIWNSKNTAYQPKSSKSIKLPNVDGAKKTRYRIAIVGPGINAGDIPDLKPDELAKLKELNVIFVLKEIMIPLLAQVFIPSLDFDHDITGDLLQDLIGVATTTIPDIIEKSEKGDLKGAMDAAWQFVKTSGSGRDALLFAILDKFGDFRTEDSRAALLRARGLANGLINVSGALDTAATSLDLLFLARAFDFSNRADIWTIDAIEEKITITPEKSKIKVDEFITLEAHVVGAETDLNFEYRYTTEGNYGKLQGQFENGKKVTSTNPFVTYDAQKAGTEYIRVEILQIIEGLAERVPVGQATAFVKVTDSTVVIEPVSADIDENESVILTAEVSGEAYQLPLRFFWSTSGDKGSFSEGDATLSPMIVEHTDASRHDTITYQADPNISGKEIIDVKVADANGRIIGENTAFINIGCDPTQQDAKKVFVDYERAIFPACDEGTREGPDCKKRAMCTVHYYIFDEVSGASDFELEVVGAENGRVPGGSRETGDIIKLFQPIGARERFYMDEATATTSSSARGYVPEQFSYLFKNNKLLYLIRNYCQGIRTDEPETIPEAIAGLQEYKQRYTNIELKFTPICE